MSTFGFRNLFCPWAAAAVFLAASPRVSGDETCQSPYMAKIVGQEDYVYVWTLGAEGLGDGQDELVTVDANPVSNGYGTVVHTVSVGGRNEAHHGGFTDDRAYFWAGGLDNGSIFIFDVHSDAGKPKLVKTLTDFVKKSGRVVGPHTFLSSEDDFLWVDTFSDGSVRLFDIRDPFHPGRCTKSASAPSSTWSRRAGTGNDCTSRAPSWRTGTRRARTTSSS